VVYEFSPSRAGEHARNFLNAWNGKLVCDDFAGYKAVFEHGITEIGCMAHARRKLFDLHVASKSQLAEQALRSIGGLYEVERQAKDMSNKDRWRLRQEVAVPIAGKPHEWILAQRERVPEESTTTKALDYSLKRWVARTRYLDDGAVPIDNNAVENQIRPWALGRSNWLFARSLRSGKRAAAIMSLIQSARMNGHDPFAYLKDVLTRLPTQKGSISVSCYHISGCRADRRKVYSPFAYGLGLISALFAALKANSFCRRAGAMCKICTLLSVISTSEGGAMPITGQSALQLKPFPEEIEKLLPHLRMLG